MRKIEPKVDEMSGEMPSTKSAKKEPIKTYPRLRMEHQYFSEVKKWEVGKEYTVKLKLKMTGISISRFQNDSEFDIIEIGIGNNDDDKK